MNLDDSTIISSGLYERLKSFDAEWRQRDGSSPSRTRLFTILLPYDCRGVRICTVAVSTTVRDGFRYHIISSYVPGMRNYYVRDHVWCKMMGWRIFYSLDQFEDFRGFYWTNNCGYDFASWAMHEFTFHCSSLHPDAPIVNLDYLAETKFRYCGYGDYRDTRYPGSLADYLTLYLRYPQIEMLSKLHLGMLITPTFLDVLKADKKLQSFIRSRATEIASCVNVSLRAIKYAYTHNCSIAFADKHFELVAYFRHVANDVNRYAQLMSPLAIRDYKIKYNYEKIHRLIDRCNITSSEYVRYLRYAFDAQHDLKSEQVMYPDFNSRERFMQSLELLEREAQRRIRAKRIADGKAKAALTRARKKGIASFNKCASKIVSSFASLKNIGLRLLSSASAFRAEGKRMRNCIGCGTYFEQYCDGRIVCVVITSDGHDYDVEISLDNYSVRQCYAKGNQRAPANVHALADSFAKYLKRKIKEGKVAA